MNNETKLKNILTANPELITPHGLDDLFAGIVKPTPAFQAMPFLAIYEKRMQQKQWQLIWPLRTIA